MHLKIKNQTGYTLVEAVVLLLIFSVMFMVMLNVFSGSLQGLSGNRAKIVAVAIANAHMEILRNIDYSNLGTTTGSPQGTIQSSSTITRSNFNYTVSTNIRYYDDPFDGCAGEAPGHPGDQWSKCADGTIVQKPRDIPQNHNNPADYKKCDVTVSWQEQQTSKTIKLSTIIAPRDLEGETDKGFMLVHIVDANGVPVPDATINVINNELNPHVSISMTSDSNGQLLLLDLVPSANYKYSVIATKDGYTTDRTCRKQGNGNTCTDTQGVPDPYLENRIIRVGELDEVTLAIDHFASLAINSYNEQCEPINNIHFTLQGLNKKISVSPTIAKNIITFVTNASLTPHWQKNDIEWDTYDLIVNTNGFNIAGINHDLALNILPNTNTMINVLLAQATSNSLLVTVKDSGTGTNLSNASIKLVNESQTYDQTKVSGQGFVEQTDWSGGSGQVDFSATDKYYSDNAQIETLATTGQISLRMTQTGPQFTEDFDNAEYKDGGNTTADWDVPDRELRLAAHLGEYPVGELQYAQTKRLNDRNAQITSARISATDQTHGQTIRYFLTADGGAHFEEVTLPMASPLNFHNIGDDLRVRIEMQTNDKDKTPVIQNFTIDYGLSYYNTPGELISSTFDLGPAASSQSEFTSISWQPANQPAEAGTDSIKFQIASNNDNSTWNFIGPDGTDNSYYTTNNASVHNSHNGHRYLRYKVYLSTQNEYYTPTLSHVRIGYTLLCMAPGQSYFKSLSAGSYVVEVSLDGYQTNSQAIQINGYTTKEILLTSNP